MGKINGINRKIIPIIAVLPLLLVILTFRAEAFSPSNSGLVGLWEYPTAEMPKDGCGFIHYSHYKPYKEGGVSLGLFPWLEFNARITEFGNAAKISENYGYYKDKALDLKLLLLKQKGIIPSVAVGVMDMMGTEIRKAYFGAGTWKYNNIALTLGYATDSYNGFYGGLSWSPWEWLEVKAEYSPLDYTKDRIIINPHAAKDKYNYGVVFKSPIGLNGSISYQRGEELCFGLSYAYDFTKPIFGGKTKTQTSEPTFSDWAKSDIPQIALSLQKELGKQGFGLRNVVVLTGDKKVHIAFENIGYSSQTEGVVRALILAAGALPWDTESLSCSPMVRGVPVSRIELKGEQISLVRLKKINAYDIGRDAVTWAPKTKYGTLPEEKWLSIYGPCESITKGAYEVRIALADEPRIDRSLNQSVFVDRIDIDYIGRLRTSAGFEAYLKVRQPLRNNVDIWWQPEMTDTTRIWQGVVSYVHKFDKNLWGLAEAGYLDHSYFGANLWGRYYIKDSPFWIGGRLTAFKERDYDSFGGLAEYKHYIDGGMQIISQNRAMGENNWSTAYWGEAGYHDATYNADIIAKYGKFADSDKGYRVDALRHWNDTTIGFYFTDTDRNTAGKSYTDAGMYLHIPLSQWYGARPSNTYYDEEFTLLSTFVLNGGRIPGAWMTPEKLLGELHPNRLNQELAPLMESIMARSGDDAAPQRERSRSYGIIELLSGEWKIDETLNDQ